MDWRDLQSGWQSRPGSSSTVEELRPETHQRIWQQVRARDGLETLVALSLAPFFAWVAVRMAVDGLYAAAFFAAFLVASVIFIAFRLWRVRSNIPDADPGRPVVEFLRAERAALIAQAEMLSSVAQWYWGPIAIGTVGLFTSVRGLVPESLAYAGCVALLCIGIEWLNRRAVRKRFDPAIAVVDAQLNSIQNRGE